MNAGIRRGRASSECWSCGRHVQRWGVSWSQCESSRRPHETLVRSWGPPSRAGDAESVRPSELTYCPFGFSLRRRVLAPSARTRLNSSSIVLMMTLRDVRRWWNSLVGCARPATNRPRRVRVRRHGQGTGPRRDEQCRARSRSLTHRSAPLNGRQPCRLGDCLLTSLPR